MMPVVRLNDATFASLGHIAAWKGIDAPAKAIEKLVQEEMERLGLERDPEEHSTATESNGDRLVFENAPGLAFTRVLSASVNHQAIEKPRWVVLLLKMVEAVKAKGLSAQQLAAELQIPAKADVYEEHGFKYYPTLGVSIQGQSAADAWKEVSRLARKYDVPVEVEFQWRENERAQYPGRVGTIRAG